MIQYCNYDIKGTLSTTGVITSGGVITAPGGNSSQWNSAYADTIGSIAFSGSTTKTLTLTQRDGGTLTSSFSVPASDNYNRWRIQADSGSVFNITSDTNVDFAGGTNITTSVGTQTGGIKVTINNGITNNNQLTNGAGYTTNTGTVTSVSQTHGGNAFTTGGSPVTSSGTLAITMAGTASQYINGAGNLITFPSIPTNTNNFVTGGNVTSGTVTLNRSGLSNISFAINNSQITNGAGYITSASIPSVGNGTFSVAGNTGLSGSGSMTANQSGNTSATLINTDRGSSQAIFKNFTADSGGTATANSNNDTMDIAGGTNVSTVRSGDSIIINATDTNTNNFVTGLSWATGTGILSATRSGLGTLTVDLDGRYVTSSGVTSVATGTGLSGGTITSTGTITNTDRGSSQAIFKNFAASSGGTATANSNNDTLTIAAGSNVTTVRSGDTITINAINDGQGVTSIATTNGITGGTITTSGTLQVDSTVIRTTGNQTLGGIKTFTSTIAGNTSGSFLLRTDGSGLTTQRGSGTVAYPFALSASTTGLFPASDNANSIFTVNRHPGNYYSQLGFSSNGNLYYRKFSNVAINTTQAWVQLATTANIGNGQIDGRTTGNGLSGSMDATANQTGNSTFTVNSNATTAASANTIAYRDSSADVSARLFRSNYTNQSDISGAIAFRYNTSDNYIRFCNNPAAIRAFIGAGTSSVNNYVTGGNVTSGTVTLNRQGLGNVSFAINNSQITNGVGYITASSSNTLTNKGGNISQWTNNSGYITSSGSISGNAATATKFSTGRTNYKGVTDTSVIGQMMWKHYGNNHTIFDASNSTSPSGSSVSNTNPGVPWTGTYPTLMGWNGSSTYGVRVDISRYADQLKTARTIAGVSFNGTANIALNNNQIANGAGYITAASLPGAPGNGTLTVQGTTGLSGSGTFTANQSGNTTITLVNSAPNIVQTTISGNAGSATKLLNARTIAGASFNGTANISLNNANIANGAGYITSGSIPSVGNGQIDGRTSGNGLSGSMDATANQSGNTTFTVSSNATTSATANTLTYRDGSGNINATAYNGLAINTSGTNNGANQIVRTQANGYANFGWINSISGNHAGSITRITASNDAYLRYVTPAQFRAQVIAGYFAPASTVSGVTSVGVTAGTGISASVSNATTTPVITITNTAPNIVQSVGNGQIVGVTSGLGLSGGMFTTANSASNATFTVSSNATTAASANTIAYRDGSADLSVRLLRANYANQGTISGAMAFRVNNSSDNYTRYCSSGSAIRGFIGAASSSVVSGVTSISTSSPVLGGTITGTGNLSLLKPVAGNWHNGGVAIVQAVTELGRYIDFHTSNTGTSDFDVRLDANGSELNCSTNFRSQGNVEAVGNMVAGYIRVTNGFSYQPSHSFTGDTNTGMYRAGTDTIGFASGGGQRAFISTSTFYVGGNLGVGTTSPSTKLHVDGVVLVRDSNGVADMYLGNYATANHFRFHTNNIDTYFDMNCGNVYWRDGGSIRYRFFPSTANMTINGTLTQNSDIRTKENIVEIPDCISKVQAMRGVYYNRTDFNTEVTKVGVIAQEVEAVLPELILENEDDGFKSVAYSELTSVLINAIKEQQEIIEDLKTRIIKLEN